MLETAVVAFTTFFATIGPVDIAIIYAVMTHDSSAEAKKAMAIRGCMIASFILTGFLLAGETLLFALGISLAALKVSGGILLLLIAIDMVFARSSGVSSTTDDENQEAIKKEDISVFPLATPLIAGPGSMGAAILLMASAEKDITSQSIVVAALISVLLITLVLLLLASKVQRLLGVTGMHVISRVFGVLLSALAVQFMFNGLAQSGLLN
ncbi:MAG: MarC family protein [Gammaproteobacteria bacterium]|nr:MarC family protein [Gammaproteobacteria bacterium]